MATYHFEHIAIRALATAIPAHIKRFDQSVHKVQRFVKQIGVGLAWGFVDLVVPAEVICPIVATEHRFDEHFLKPLTD